MYDLFASQYSYTIDDFKNLTMKQLDLLIERIDVRLNNEYAVNAALHGHKVKMKSLRDKVSGMAELSAAQKNKVNEAVKRRQEEMKREVS